MKTNVKLFGYAEYPYDGPTHSCPNIKEIMNNFSNIKSFYPQDEQEFLESFEQTKKEGPTFIKLINI